MAKDRKGKRKHKRDIRRERLGAYADSMADGTLLFALFLCVFTFQSDLSFLY